MCSTKPSSCLLAPSLAPPHGVNLGWGGPTHPPLPTEHVLTGVSHPSQAEVQPQCGRAVGFSSGSENPHGVKAVTKGQRCAIALWFTLDPRHSERVSSLPSSGWGFLGGDNGHAYPHGSAPQERVQADDLVKMLFGTEEGDLLREPEPEQEPPAAVAVGKDEL